MVLDEKEAMELELRKLVGSGFESDCLNHARRLKIGNYAGYYVVDYGYWISSAGVIMVVGASQYNLFTISSSQVVPDIALYEKSES